MKQLLDTLEKFVTYNLKDSDMSRNRPRLQRVNYKSGWEFVSNGFVILANKTDKPDMDDSPDAGCILNARSLVKTIVTVDIRDIEQAIMNADVFAREGANMLVLDIRNGMAFVSAKSEEYGQMTRCLNNATITGPDLFIAFNTSYLRNCIRFHGKSGLVTLEFNKPNSPSFVAGADPDKLSCLMPMMTGDCEWVENGAASLYCPELPGTQSESPKYYTLPCDEWECIPQYRYNMETGKSEEIPFELPTQSVPACDAVTNELVTVSSKLPDSGYDKELPALLIFSAYTVSDPINTVEAGPQNSADRPSDGKPTKSELMTTLNKERARIRREYKNLPATCARELERLYKAFGNLQRKDWKQTAEKMNVTKDGAFDYLGMKSTRALLEKVYSLRPNAQPINVTSEFEKLNTKVTR